MALQVATVVSLLSSYQNSTPSWYKLISSWPLNTSCMFVVSLPKAVQRGLRLLISRGLLFGGQKHVYKSNPVGIDCWIWIWFYSIYKLQIQPVTVSWVLSRRYKILGQKQRTLLFTAQQASVGLGESIAFLARSKLTSLCPNTTSSHRLPAA